MTAIRNTTMPKDHSCRGNFGKNAGRKLKLILTIVRRDFAQIQRQGLPALLLFSGLLFFFGFVLFSAASSTLREIGVPTWTGTITGAEGGSGSGEGFLSSLTLLLPVYGYAILVTMILIPVAFSASYGSEIKKGTVRTLTCYPVGVFEITIAKLLYAAIAGLIFTLPVYLLPVLMIQKPLGDLLLIYAASYTATLVIVAVGAFLANTLAFVTKKMYIQPTLLANLLVIFSFLITTTVLGGLSSFLKFLSPLFDAAAKLTPLSLYHQAHLLLSSLLGGADSPMWLVFLVPLALLVLGMGLTLKLWPDIYERE